MSSSFLSEHTCEFILIPKFYEMLSNISERITPIFFWSTREGASISKASFKNKPIVIVAMYARRPKLASLDSFEIELKFNAELFSRSAYLVSNGIPVFAGTPLVTKLDEFVLGADCSWFSILPANTQDDEYIKIDNLGKVIENSSNNIKAVTTNEIVKKIKNTSKQLTWDVAIKIIKNNKYDDQNARWFFGNGYKPVYFILDVSEKS